jgi:hypothetical protein
MNTEQIVSQIDLEIARLRQVRALLTGEVSEGRTGPGRPRKIQLAAPVPSVKTKRKPLSAEAKARIAAAQKARWAKARKQVAK